jgi:hypothetical protein
MGPRSWEEHRLLVTESLIELKDDMKEVRKAQEQIRQEIIMLKVKSSLWGGLAGTVPAIVVGVMAWLKT